MKKEFIIVLCCLLLTSLAGCRKKSKSEKVFEMLLMLDEKDSHDGNAKTVKS